MSDTPIETINEFPAFEPQLPAPGLPMMPPTPNNPPWTSGMAIGMWIVSVALILVVPALFLTPYALSLASKYPDKDAMMTAITTDPFAIGLQILATIPAHLLTLLLAWLVVTKGRKFRFFETLGWRAGGMEWWHYLMILGGFFALVIVVGSVVPEQENEMLRILKSSRSAVYLVAFMAVFTAPLTEEVIYRGLLYSALQRTLGVGGAFALVTFLFALVHVPQYYPSISTMLLLTILSLVLTLIRVKTDNLLPCVILHTLFNAAQSILLLLEPYLPAGDPVENATSAVVHIFR